jgi:serine protease AprX
MQPSNHRSSVRAALMPQVIMEPLRSRVDSGGEATHHVIIEVNTGFESGLMGARKKAREYVAEVMIGNAGVALRRNLVPEPQHPYLFAELTASQMLTIVAMDGATARDIDAVKTGSRTPSSTDSNPIPTSHRHLRAIWKIWESATLAPLTTKSVKTVKADASLTAFAASGEDIVWAILDSGIDKNHSHFVRYKNLDLQPPLVPRNFAPSKTASEFEPLEDAYGHGTHVAGIIAGAADSGAVSRAAVQSVDPAGTSSEFHLNDVTSIRGMAPQCKLLSLRILDDNGAGDATAAINALEYVMQLNAYGANIIVHGVNMSAGYLPDAQSYAIGGSPLCRVVDRAVRTGIVVVVAAGNFGYVLTRALGAGNSTQNVPAGQLSSIADPGNADLAITVGSTHREDPHTFGVSYFSSRGPTVDGRQKPDIVAPGERIISCAAGSAKLTAQYLLPAAPPNAPVPSFDYLEDTGTSMAAPHVAGVIAAFLSIRREFIGKPLAVRNLLTESAVDLKRDARMQGAGLVDLFRMLQSV